MVKRAMGAVKAAAPAESDEVFELAADGRVSLRTEQPLPEQHSAVRAAAKYCPTRAIQLEE